MDKTPREVTDKIRRAIKEKLVELNLFVDDELPDYIMILIANKRSKNHMEKDLSLFLGNQTVDFSNWLWNLVYNFKVGTHTKNAKPRAVLDSNAIQESKMEEDDVLNYDPAEEGETLCLDEINDPVTSQPVIPQTFQVKNETTLAETSKMSHPTPPISLTLTSSMSMKVPESSQNKILKVDESPQNIIPSAIPKITNVMKTQPSSTVKSVKVYPFSQSKQNLIAVNEGVKPLVKVSESKQPDFAGVNSVVCVTQRKYKGPAALQANKLLLKAVQEATKSVLNGQSIEEYYKPTMKCVPSLQLENSVLPDHNSCNEITTDKILVSEKRQSVSVKPFEINEVSNSSDEAVKSTLQSKYAFKDSNPSHSLVRRYLPSEEEKDAITPHFIVTLDGINLPSLKRKHSIEEPMDVVEEEEEEAMEEFEEDYTKKQKFNERCKYWPACKNKDCCYHHPTIPCKCFPDCKFGEKCLYVHPNCKFDSLCSRKECPYTHCSKRRFKKPLPAIIKPPVKLQSAKVVCRYYPKCTAKSCRFLHPRLCRFGTQCRSPTCPFSHFQVPQRAQLKWKAGSS